jgi:TolA-binding protein
MAREIEFRRMGDAAEMTEVRSGWIVSALQVLSILGWLAIVPVGCAIGGFGSGGVSAEERTAFDAAIVKVESDPRDAEASLKEFLDLYPKSALADDAAEELAELAFAAGREDEGLRWLGRILRQAPDGDRAAPARLRLAKFEYGRNRWSTSRTDAGRKAPASE